MSNDSAKRDHGQEITRDVFVALKSGDLVSYFPETGGAMWMGIVSSLRQITSNMHEMKVTWISPRMTEARYYDRDMSPGWSLVLKAGE